MMMKAHMTTIHADQVKNNFAATLVNASVCATAIALVYMFAAVAMSNHVAAQTPTSTLPLATTPQLSVKPLVGVVGEPRTLTVTGQWPNACPPVAATLDASLFTVAKTITIRLQTPLTLVACAATLTPYRFDLAYAAREIGVARVLMVSSTGTPTGEGRVETTTLGMTRAAGDISGAWFDPATSGSGLSFVHAYQGSDTVFGTWYLYDRDGLSRWITIQGVTWSEGGMVMDGSLYETRAGADICSPSVIACPASSVALAKIGRVHASFTGIGLQSDTKPQARIEAFSNTDTLLFSSNISRAF